MEGVKDLEEEKEKEREGKTEGTRSRSSSTSSEDYIIILPDCFDTSRPLGESMYRYVSCWLTSISTCWCAVSDCVVICGACKKWLKINRQEWIIQESNVACLILRSRWRPPIWTLEGICCHIPFNSPCIVPLQLCFVPAWWHTSQDPHRPRNPISWPPGQLHPREGAGCGRWRWCSSRDRGVGQQQRQRHALYVSDAGRWAADTWSGSTA